MWRKPEKPDAPPTPVQIIDGPQILADPEFYEPDAVNAIPPCVAMYHVKEILSGTKALALAEHLELVDESAHGPSARRLWLR